jgi:DNA-binding NarL/FixJ family response regulator
MTLKIFIVEDHPILLYTLKGFIKNEAGLQVCGTATTGAEALERLAETEADLALIDVKLPGISGLELLEQLRERYPGLLCLMLSGHGETTYIQQALRAGARGYILKGNPDEMLAAIQTVAGGGTYLSPSLPGGDG